MYLFYSSDIFELYRKDMLSAISLPNGYCLHVRYPASVVPATLQQDARSLIEKEALLIYVAGNTGSVVDDRQVRFLPIRSATVRDAFVDSETGLYHFFLELGRFVKGPVQLPQQPATIPRNQEVPPYLFIHDSPALSWSAGNLLDKVEEMVTFDSRFTDQLIFNISVRPSGASSFPLQITYDNQEKTSFYSLQEDREYVLEISFINTAAKPADFEKYALQLAYDSDYLFITNPQEISIGANADNRSYKLMTTDIKTAKTAAYVKFQSVENGGNSPVIKYELLLRFKINRSPNKLMYVALIALALLIGTTCSALAINEWKERHVGSGLAWFAGAMIMLAVAPSMQFFFFNKRS